MSDLETIKPVNGQLSGISGENSPIVAISTAIGRSAIGIVRVSGSCLDALILRLFRPARGPVRLDDRRPHLGTFLDEHGEGLDEGLLIWMRGPRSFTGEDVVEMHAHGNPWILERLVQAALSAGARAAAPGEFTRRAYLNGRLDLVQADAVMQLIHASSERGLQAARRLLSGELSCRFRALQDSLVDILKWLEMAIDFPEEDTDAASDEELLLRLLAVESEVETLLSGFRRGVRARHGARVVICGRANVGKSSLFNALLGFRRSIVADVPGTTRDLVEFSVELGGWSVILQDTAGLRESLDDLEKEGVGRARDAIGGADLGLVVVDGSCAPREEDWEVLETVKRVGLSWIGVLNKSDLGVDVGWRTLGEGWLELSAREGLGLEVLRSRLERELGEGDRGEEVLLTSSWQRDLLQRVKGNVQGAKEAIMSGLTPEATALELYEALDRLDEILGTRGREVVMDRVFAEFCLGK